MYRQQAMRGKIIHMRSVRRVMHWSRRKWLSLLEMRNETKNIVIKSSKEIMKRNDEKYNNPLDNIVRVKRIKKK